MEDKTAKSQWNWKFGLLSAILLAQIMGFCDLIFIAGLDPFSFSDIYNFLSLSYLWFLNCAVGLILFLISTIVILSPILKNLISNKKTMIAYLGFPLFLLINLVGLNWLTAAYNLLALLRSWRIIYIFLIFLLAFFLAFSSALLSMRIKKRSSISTKVFRILATCIICITFCSIFFTTLITIAIVKMELYPEEFGVITCRPKEAAHKASNLRGGSNSILHTIAEKKKGGIISGGKANRPNLIFISIDTLRADHLSCYRYKKLNTHNIDALAQKGVRFAQAYTSVPMTLPSHSSMMTGLYPMHHGALYNNNYLNNNNITLAEILKDYGYTTAAYISAFPLSARFNFYQGFDYFNNERRKSNLIAEFPLRKYTRTWIIHFLSSFRLLSLVNLSRKGEEITESAIDWLKNNHKEPFFLFLHVWDPHGPYRPPKKYLKPQYHNNASWFQFLKCFNPLEKKYPYDGEVAYVDEEIGRLKHFLENSGISKNSIIVFTADHGVGLGDHNYNTHTERVYEEQLHVPLFIIYPPLIPEGKVVNHPVNIVNIMPTILDMLTITIPQGLDGSSTLPFINEEEINNSSPIYATAWPTKEPPYYRLGAIIKDDWKLISNLQNKKGDQLYYLKDDPKELNNLAEKEKKIVAELKPLLLKWVWEIPKGAYINNKLKDRDTIERLKALGYFN